MKNALVLFLSLIFCVLPAAQDLPHDILADQYLLEATKALENDDPESALRAFEKIEALDVEPPPEFLFFYGKLLVEHSTVPDDLLKGQSYLKQYVLNVEKGSEHYRSALELLMVVEKKMDQVYEAEKQRKKADALAEKISEDMAPIPGGTFRMGDLSGGLVFFQIDEAKPVHTVSIKSFKLGKYEVTFDQWDTCVADGGCGGYWPSDEGWGRGNRPVINVSWDDAQLYIDWLNSKNGGNYRLPTEAEWEYAARAGSTTKYSWGDDIGVNQANCNGCGSQWDNEKTAPVGSFPPNAWGLHDMHGNVYEWIQDCGHDDYRDGAGGAPSDGSAWTSDCRASWADDYGGISYNDSDSSRVIRGGSWRTEPSLYILGGGLRSAGRGWRNRTNRDSYSGFRLAQDQ